VKVLVTGATGFTGGHLARRLRARGDDVRVLVRHPERATDLRKLGAEVAKGDLTDPSSLVAAAAGVEVIYNIAALYRTAGLPAGQYRAVNALGVRAVIAAARATGAKRVVHCSTVGVHGDVEHPPADEDAPLRPGDVYQETKLEGEAIGREAAASAGVELVIARPSGIYGPGDRRLFKLFGAIAKGTFIMLGDGNIFYHLTYIDDLCDGFVLCATVPQAAGRTYILAGGEVTTLDELIGITAEVAQVPRPKRKLPVWPIWLAGALCEGVCRPLGIEPPLYRRRVDFFTKSRAFDISRARRELGFNPAVGLREGIGRTLEWYREQRWL
jgi:dihydroflavonol-4-reductase